MAGISDVAAKVRAPTSSAEPGVGTTQLDTTASSQRFEVPVEWRGRFIRLTCTELDIDMFLGGDAIVAVMEEASTVSSEVITPKVTTGDRFLAGQSDHIFIPKTPGITHFAFISTGTTGKVYFRPT